MKNLKIILKLIKQIEKSDNNIKSLNEIIKKKNDEALECKRKADELEGVVYSLRMQIDDHGKKCAIREAFDKKEIEGMATERNMYKEDLETILNPGRKKPCN